MRRKVPSFANLPFSILKEDFTLAELKVYIALLKFQGANDCCWPSLEKMGELTGLAMATISRATGSLEEKKWIKKVQRGSKRTNAYVVFYEPTETDLEDEKEFFEAGKTDSDLIATSSHDLTAKSSHSYNSIIINNNIRKYLHTEAKGTDSPSKSDPLYNAVWSSFLSKTGLFADYKKEGACTKKLVQSFKNLSADAPELFAQKIIEKFYELTQGNDRFWTQTPFTPSGLTPHVQRIAAIVARDSVIPSAGGMTDDDLSKIHF